MRKFIPLLALGFAACATAQSEPSDPPEIVVEKKKIVRVEVRKEEGAAFDEAAALASVETETDQIKALMDRQDTAWNAGDIEGFMQGYWQSPELRFASGDTIVHGWQETLDRYKARYSNRALMGELDTEMIEIEVFNDMAVVFGSWALTRPEKGDVGGLFTLMLRKIDGEWLIVSDHTS